MWAVIPGNLNSSSAMSIDAVVTEKFCGASMIGTGNRMYSLLLSNIYDCLR
jgi:hypothetical protein